MGYYTDYQLSSDTGVETTEEFIKTFKRITSYAPDNLSDIRWYDSETHMREISLLYPDTLFTLTSYTSKELNDYTKTNQAWLDTEFELFDKAVETVMKADWRIKEDKNLE